MRRIRLVCPRATGAQTLVDTQQSNDGPLSDGT
jgi:hypothetical protein